MSISQLGCVYIFYLNNIFCVVVVIILITSHLNFLWDSFVTSLIITIWCGIYDVFQTDMSPPMFVCQNQDHIGCNSNSLTTETFLTFLTTKTHSIVWNMIPLQEILKPLVVDELWIQPIWWLLWGKKPQSKTRLDGSLLTLVWIYLGFQGGSGVEVPIEDF